MSRLPRCIVFLLGTLCVASPVLAAPVTFAVDRELPCYLYIVGDPASLSCEMGASVIAVTGTITVPALGVTSNELAIGYDLTVTEVGSSLPVRFLSNGTASSTFNGAAHLEATPTQLFFVTTNSIGSWRLANGVAAYSLGTHGSDVLESVVLQPAPLAQGDQGQLLSTGTDRVAIGVAIAPEPAAVSVTALALACMMIAHRRGRHPGR